MICHTNALVVAARYRHLVESLKRVEWRLLQQKTNAHGFGMACLTVKYECNVQVSTKFCPNTVVYCVSWRK